ncbi:MAG: PilX N-terminal domain-containing pilus assembly protein [Thiobacillaceae bacterium]
MMSIRFLQSPPKQQSGAVLITGLIFMVVMTIIVIAALRSATLEERMAANARNRQLALQAAEAVLRYAETTLFTAAPFSPLNSALFTTGCTSGLCNKPVAGAEPRWKTMTTAQWSDPGITLSFNDAGASDLDGVASQPRYIVEKLNNPSNTPGQACSKILYKITARGVGMDNSTVFVQTMVRSQPSSCPA